MHHFGYSPRLQPVYHQMAHLPSEFYQAGMVRAMGISCDAYGDKLSAALALWDEVGKIKLSETRPAGNSLGLFCAIFTSFLGFTPGEDE